MDKPPVSAKLERMLAFGPAQVVYDVIHRHAVDRFSGLIRQRIDEAEICVLTSAPAAQTVTLANVAIAQVVDKIRSEYVCVAGRNALRVVNLRVRRWLAWELLDSTKCVFLEVAAHEDALLLVGGVINAGNAGIQSYRLGRRKRVRAGI